MLAVTLHNAEIVAFIVVVGSFGVMCLIGGIWGIVRDRRGRRKLPPLEYPARRHG